MITTNEEDIFLWGLAMYENNLLVGLITSDNSFFKQAKLRKEKQLADAASVKADFRRKIAKRWLTRGEKIASLKGAGDFTVRIPGQIFTPFGLRPLIEREKKPRVLKGGIKREGGKTRGVKGPKSV